MIKDDLTLDGTPTLNLASFVTTYMVSPHAKLANKLKLTHEQEEEAEKLMVYVEQARVSRPPNNPLPQRRLLEELHRLRRVPRQRRYPESFVHTLHNG